MLTNIKKIIVLKDDDPLKRIAEFGEETKNAWIFLNKDAISRLRDTAIEVRNHNGATYNYGGRIVHTRYFTDEWRILDEVTIGEGINEFKAISNNPECIFMVEMAK